MLESIVKQIHEKGVPKLVLYVTGGGTEAISSLLKYGGGSATFLEGLVNYCTESTHQLIGGEPKNYASLEVARKLAMAAYLRAKELHEDEVVGVACTCKLRKPGERPNREHKLCLAIQTDDRTETFEVPLTEPRNRCVEEDIVRDIIVQIIATKVYCIQDVHIIEPYRCREAFNSQTKHDVQYDSSTGELLNRENNFNLRPLSYQVGSPDQDECLIFPGSFNPLHKKHIEMAELAIEKTGLPLWFEISVFNTDKPPIDFISLRDRLESFETLENPKIGGVIISNTPMFVDKVKLFPKATFVVGADTINRIYHPKYEKTTKRLKGTGFIVFPRQGEEIITEFLMTEQQNGRWAIPDNIVLMKNYVDDGTSSSQIREEA